MMRYVLVALFALSLTACTNESEAISVLSANGFTDISITGYEPFACSKGDDYHTGFRAKSAAGHYVTGAVCGGILKGSTIRFK